jgi:hypothetical protein
MNPLKQLAARGAIQAQRLTGNAGHVARRTSSIVETWFHAQEGPAVLRAVAAVSIVSQLADLVHSMWGFEDLIVAAGWQIVPLPSDAHATLLSRLRTFAVALPEVEDEDGENMGVLTWMDEDGVAVVMATESKWNGKFAEAQPGALDALVGRHIWCQSILEIMAATDDDGRSSTTLTARGEIDRVLIGGKVAEVEQACMVGEEPRVVAVLGATGSGKTSSVYQALKGRRVLCNVGNVLSPSGLLTLERTLKPDVVILDDLEMSDDFDARLGQALDRLHEEVSLVVITVMLDQFLTLEEMQAGDMYWSGMRPGRIDQFVFIGKLSAADRERVLDLYDCPVAALAEAVEATHGLSAAYLREVALRLSRGGGVADNVRLQAPEEMSAAPANVAASAERPTLFPSDDETEA